jgi:CcmD family protein
MEMGLNSLLGIFLLSPEPDFFRSLGKIYVVVGVLAIIFIGVGLYLFFIDRKISKLEKTVQK